MSRPIKKIYDCATNETIERDFTDEEFEQYGVDAENAIAAKAEAEADAQAKAELLERLGITADEAKLLLA
jgi:hypothetical protein